MGKLRLYWRWVQGGNYWGQSRKLDKMKIIYYTSSEGLYLANAGYGYGGRHSLSIDKVNGKPIKDTCSSLWKFVEGESEIKNVRN
jgi:hypothetical protein